MSEQLWYYIDQAQAQIGPITIPELQALVASSAVTPETAVWTEALGEQWIPACNVEGLFPESAHVEPDPNTGTVAVKLPSDISEQGLAQELSQAPAPPVPAPAPVLRAPGAIQSAQPAQTVAEPQQPQMAPTTPMIPSTPTTQPVPGTAAPIPGALVAQQSAGAVAGADPFSPPQTNPQNTSGDYPATIQKGGSFMMWLLFILSGMALFGFALFSMFAGVSAAMETTVAGGSEDQAAMQAAAGGGIGLILMLCGSGLLIASSIFTYIYLYRAWAALQPGGATVSPGKAIGFLFIPLFNIYWIFVALGGLPKQWNSITSRYDNTKSAPKLSLGMFLCMLFIPIIGAILWHKQIINGINFMAKIGQGDPATSSALGEVSTPSMAAVAHPVEQAHPGMLDMSAVADVAPIPAGTAPVAIKAPVNPLLGANAPAAAAKPSPFAGVHAATKPNPLLTNAAAAVPQNKLNVSLPAAPAAPPTDNPS